MTLVELQQERDELAQQIAQTIEQANQERKELVDQIEQKRLEEAGPAILRIRELMAEYDIPRHEIFADINIAPVAKETWFSRVCNVFRNQGSNNKITDKSATLSDMRKSSDEIWGD